MENRGRLPNPAAEKRQEKSEEKLGGAVMGILWIFVAVRRIAIVTVIALPILWLLHKPSVAAQVSINYLSAAKGTRLFASSKCIKTGRSTTVASVDVYDELGTKVALFTGTAFKL